MGLVRVVLGLALTFVFVMAGSVKLTPNVQQDQYEEIAAAFSTKYADIWSIAEFGITADEFRLAIGGAEVVLAIFLWILPRFSALGLMVIMACAMYSHYAAQDPPGTLALTGTLFLLLGLFSLLSGPAPKKHRKKTD